MAYRNPVVYNDLFEALTAQYRAFTSTGMPTNQAIEIMHRYRLMRVGNGPPEEVLEGLRMEPLDIYYDAVGNLLWQFHTMASWIRGNPNRTWPSGKYSMWMLARENVTTHLPPILQYYYDAYEPVRNLLATQEPASVDA